MALPAQQGCRAFKNYSLVKGLNRLISARQLKILRFGECS